MSTTRRALSTSHTGRNGFLEHPSTNDDVSNPTTEQLEASERAMFILNHKRRPFPSLSEMRSDAGNSVNVDALSRRILEVKEDYVHDLTKLYQLHGQQYQEEAMDRFLSKDETQYRTEGENHPVSIASYDHMQYIYEKSRNNLSLQNSFDDDRSRLEYSYLNTLLPLQTQRERLSKKDALNQQQKDQQFPASVEVYRSLEPAVQRRIANFLTSNDVTKETMRSQYGWAWRQTKPLQDVYMSDGDFKREILAQSQRT